jgi:hypothetical protein
MAVLGEKPMAIDSRRSGSDGTGPSRCWCSSKALAMTTAGRRFRIPVGKRQYRERRRAVLPTFQHSHDA